MKFHFVSRHFVQKFVFSQNLGISYLDQSFLFYFNWKFFWYSNCWVWEVQPLRSHLLMVSPDCLLGWENDRGEGVVGGGWKKDEKTENSSKNLFWILFGIYCRIVSRAFFPISFIVDSHFSGNRSVHENDFIWCKIKTLEIKTIGRIWYFSSPDVS